MPKNNKSLNTLLEILKNHNALENPQQIKKGSALLSANNVAKNIFYIKKGIVKVSFFSEKKRKEATLSFFSEGDLLVPYKSFFEKLPAKATIIALTDLVFYTIEKDFLDELENEIPELKDLKFQLVLERTYEFIDKIIESAFSFSTKELYISLLKKKPYLKNVSDEEIGLYFGVDRITIQRIKREINQQKK